TPPPLPPSPEGARCSADFGKDRASSPYSPFAPFLARAKAAASSARRSSLTLKFGFLPLRNGCRSHSLVVQPLAPLADPPEQSIQRRRMALSAVPPPPWNSAPVMGHSRG